MKKVLIALCAVFLLTVLPGTVNAEEAELTKAQEMTQETRNLYKKCVKSAGVKSFQGYCGLMTSYQLWKLGINEDLLVYDGNRQYDVYKNLEMTTGGYRVKAYDVKEYTLEEALNAISNHGTRDVRNILVGFQWTNTEAGAKYGHCCVINGIVDGVVYFTESFNYAMGKAAGQVINCTIPEFVELFKGWTKFEGIIYFGEKDYAAGCTAYSTDTYLQLRFESNLRSQPCLIGENDCARLRTLSAGEIVHATAVYESHDGDLFYCIEDGEETGYVSANAAYLLQGEPEPVTLDLAAAKIPTALTSGADFDISGRVAGKHSAVSALQLEVSDGETVLLQAEAEVGQSLCDLNIFNKQLAFDTLPEGMYTLTLTADANYTVVEGGVCATRNQEQVLYCEPLVVGNCPAESSVPDDPETKDGWFVRNGIWYCYQQGVPCTGWVTRLGVSYYLKEDGSVTTGWTTVEGVKRYFSPTGALCTGWVDAPEGTYYWDKEGTMVTGLCEIDGKRYCFTDEGTLITTGTVTYEDTNYTVQADGRVLPVL